MAISAAQVKDLREKTGAGMMDCKKALVEADGDMDSAIEYLRKAGTVKAEKKAGRATNEGRITTYHSDGVAVIAEVLCETDFVAKNETFGKFCNELTSRVASDYDTTGDLAEQVAENEKGHVADLITNVGENIQINRVTRWQLDGDCASYIHMGGRIGVLVEVTGDSDDEFNSNLGMHIAAFNPPFLDPDSVPAEIIEKEKEIAAAQPDLANKPANILDKILDGKIRKWYNENCLVKQAWVRDDKTTVEKVKPNAQIKRFVRWQVGESA